MPKMGDAMTEGKILRWHKRPGDQVQKGEPIAEIETDKVNVDVEAEESGTLVEIVVSEGQTAAVGAKIAAVGKPGEKVVQPIPAAPPEARSSKPAPSKVEGPEAREFERLKASPIARRLAEEHGIDLAQVSGSGPEGRITKEDIEALIARAAPAQAPARAPAAPVPAGPDYEDLSPSRMRQTIARRMTESKQAPHFYVTVEVVMDEALRARQQLNAAVGEAGKVSINDFIIKAAALALRSFPNINSAYLNGKIRRHRRIHVANAIAIPEGLVAPVVRDADRLSIIEVGAKMRDLAERTRSNRLRPDEYEGGTFTISNLGMFEVENFVAIINPPHAAILAVGNAQSRAVVRNGQVTVASIMKLTLSADHRVTDGAEVAKFLTEVKRLLENPLLLFLPEQS
ncbi:MAG: 2-oxo acid dehydrogenase subunit E2 [Armatimonadetes bacterium]|nr:2-oxo acid dehydrogenase subunit E2 [Armatimonadota bacterium]